MASQGPASRSSGESWPLPFPDVSGPHLAGKKQTKQATSNTVNISLDRIEEVGQKQAFHYAQQSNFGNGAETKKKGQSGTNESDNIQSFALSHEMHTLHVKSCKCLQMFCCKEGILASWKYVNEEAEVHCVLQPERAKKKQVSGLRIQANMRKLVREQLGEEAEKAFAASHGCFNSFLSRHDLSLCARSNKNLCL